ncbi:disulfide bond formation protein B [Actibacterium sp. XHP0104]|uniref:disulfide bond formation protein B n=1 Tax=Actibacterium sp. XHP0104 TaxID=2984335 RepID=UPI0021E91714|nr:disulfide bond formation protein B [Actibacterium sp. XHP0104]MCV2881114.1 disulfide bond formation protein B [Actibacterium sp. XHP0104]
MTRQFLVLIAAGGSFAMLAGAFAFQYLGGLAPCELCLWQRWPHGAAIVIGGLAMLAPLAVLCWLGALAAAATGAIGVYHTGVERGWWAGPDSCTGGGGLGGPGNLLDFANAPKVVMCDQVAWEMFGLSMASWNALAAFMFAALWILAARTRP